MQTQLCNSHFTCFLFHSASLTLANPSVAATSVDGQSRCLVFAKHKADASGMTDISLQQELSPSRQLNSTLQQSFCCLR